MLLMVTKDIGTWSSVIMLLKYLEIFFKKSGQAVITSHNGLQHVSQDCKIFKTLVNIYKMVKNFKKFVLKKWTSL